LPESPRARALEPSDNSMKRQKVEGGMSSAMKSPIDPELKKLKGFSSAAWRLRGNYLILTESPCPASN
jgi:hypothetical protein